MRGYYIAWQFAACQVNIKFRQLYALNRNPCCRNCVCLSREGKEMKNRLMVILMTAAAFVSLTACASRVYYVGGPPAPHGYWVPGHYDVGPYGGQHWVPGHYR